MEENTTAEVLNEMWEIRGWGFDMVGKYKVITLCGSTRFKDEFLEAQKKLALEGNIVINIGMFGHSSGF